MSNHGWPLVSRLRRLGWSGPFLLRRYRRRTHVLCGCRRRLFRFGVGLGGAPLFERLSGDQELDLGCIERLAFEQRFSDPDQGFTVRSEDRLGTIIPTDDHAAHFFVDRNGGSFAIVAMLSNLASQEDLF